MDPEEVRSLILKKEDVNVQVGRARLSSSGGKGLGARTGLYIKNCRRAEVSSVSHRLAAHRSPCLSASWQLPVRCTTARTGRPEARPAYQPVPHFLPYLPSFVREPKPLPHLEFVRCSVVLLCREQRGNVLKSISIPELTGSLKPPLFACVPGQREADASTRRSLSGRC